MSSKGQHYWTKDTSKLLRVGEGFRLADVDPSSSPGYAGGKKEGKSDLVDGAKQMGPLQERLYAESRSDATDASVLLVLQALDSAGKGGIIRYVVGTVDPQGITIAAFKQPSDEELKHDFLWRFEKRLPTPGLIGVFDRSYYEDVLIARVRKLAPAKEIERRYGAIVDFEKQLTDSGTRIVKVMLHISSDEQKKRLLRRLNRPDKHWKFNPSDIDERGRWDEYMDAYQIALERTSSEHAPWYVVPANHKWYARVAVQELVTEALMDIDPQWPKATYDIEAQKKRLAAT